MNCLNPRGLSQIAADNISPNNAPNRHADIAVLALLRRVANPISVRTGAAATRRISQLKESPAFISDIADSMPSMMAEAVAKVGDEVACQATLKFAIVDRDQLEGQ